MKKLLAILLVLVLCAGLIAGCGSSSSTSSTAISEGSTAESTTSTAGSDYPKSTITAICPWSPGGGTDTVLRAICSSAEKELGQTIAVSNVTGGGGATGHAAIMTAEPDGYTVGMITFELNSLPPQGLINFTYEDFDPLLRLNMDAAVLTVKADAPYNTLEEFIAYAKENPGKVTVGNSGTGSVWHLAGGLIEEKCGISLKHIPYDGAAPAVTDLAGGHIDAVTVSGAEVLAQVKAGTLKMIAIALDERDENFPEVPTFKELGYDIVFGTWRGIAVPKGTPDDIKATIVGAFTTAFESSEFQQIASDLGLGLSYQGPEDFTKFLGENAAMVKDTMTNLGLV